MQPVPGVPPLTLGVPSSVAVPPGSPTLASRFPSLASSLQGCLTGLGGQQGEKQLFEKFWKGTFKAVATPRLESVIVASITARRRVTSAEPSACPAAGGDEREAESDSRASHVPDRQPCSPRKRRKHGSHRRARRGSFDGDISPLPASKGKKRKRRSERKRRRRRKRSPSYSLSPQRKKKKKKKSSKKSKRHRYSSRKTKHSSSSLKRKRKDDRKHKKSSRGHSHRRRRYRRSESESSAWRSSSAESRHRQRKSARPSALQRQAARRAEDTALDRRGLEWGPAAKSVCKPAPNYPSILATGTILPSNPGDDILNAKGVQHHTIPNSGKGPQDYDSGNDTSSPPSTKTAGSRANGIGDKRPLCGGLASPEKLRFAEGDNISDSGNSVTSYASLSKPLPANNGLSTSVLSENSKSEQMSSRCRAEAARPPQTAISPSRALASPRGRRRAHSSSSRSSSRSRSSGRFRHSGRYSRSPTPSSHSYVGSLRRRGSVGSTSSRGSYPRLSPDRVRVRRGSPSPRGQDVKSGQRYKGKRRGGRSYSPMRKRRRDSPSHLEARRITSARKRPVPYFRPSPSSSGRSSSASSWSSLFTRSRSRSPARSLGRSRTRSRSYSSSSYRSYSPSSSWNSIFGGRSRSRSRRL